MEINCKRAAELCSHAMHRKLSRYERLCLALHMMICTACRRVRRQMRLLRTMLRELEAQRMEAPARERIPTHVRARIALALRSRLTP